MTSGRSGVHRIFRSCKYFHERNYDDLAIVSWWTSKPTSLLDLSMTCPLNWGSGPLVYPTSSLIHAA